MIDVGSYLLGLATLPGLVVLWFLSAVLRPSFAVGKLAPRGYRGRAANLVWPHEDLRAPRWRISARWGCLWPATDEAATDESRTIYGPIAGTALIRRVWNNTARSQEELDREALARNRGAWFGASIAGRFAVVGYWRS